METNKLLALAQHLNIPHMKVDDLYYFGINEQDWLNSNKPNNSLYFHLWAIEQDNYIKFEEDVEVSGDYYTYEGEEYLILDNDEADTAWGDSIDNYIDECVLPDVPKQYHRYFDREAFMKDCEYDGRGLTLATYDGYENEERVDNTTYYLYRTN